MADDDPRDLYVLFVQGIHTDPAPVVRELWKSGFVARRERVSSLGALEEALVRRPWELVIADPTLPGLGLLQALGLTVQHAPGVPFVVVADALPEEEVVEVLRAGASDWVTRGRLDRLGPVVVRALARVRTNRAADAADPEALYGRLLEAQEAERRRIAAMLHDELGQTLVALRLSLYTAAPQHGGLVEALRLADEAIGRSRDLSVELWPAVLDHLGLPAALRWLAERHENTGLTFEVIVEPVGRLPVRVEAAAFRVAQEALRNIVRHAEATEVTLCLTFEDGVVDLAIRDDGVGFDTEHAWNRVFAGRSLGLLGMREHARLGGGWLEIGSAPGRGTVVRAGLPTSTGGD